MTGRSVDASATPDGTSVTRQGDPVGSADAATLLDQWFARQRLTTSRWSNAAGDRYGWHAHLYHKVLACQEGSIVFHLRDGDLTLLPGDRLELEPQTDHAATVGPKGVVCVEAAR